MGLGVETGLTGSSIYHYIMLIASVLRERMITLMMRLSVIMAVELEK